MNDKLIGMNKKQARHKRILHKMELRGRVSVDELSEEFRTSEATIRRDIELLEQEGRLIRVRGGAQILNGIPVIAKEFGERSKRYLAEKEQIVNTVAEHIPEGSVLVLDNGTTSMVLAKKLRERKNLTVATNSLPIVEELGKNPNFRVMLSGGIFRQRNLDFTGAFALDFFRNLNADIAIMTCDAVNPVAGFFKLSDSSAAIARAMMAGARKVFVIADHSKINAKGTYLFLNAGDADCFFTDSGVPEPDRERLNAGSFNIIYC
jgi:DeoR family transcriptional regulator of aga operon/DeoR family fructose operon transcriptional repressor